MSTRDDNRGGGTPNFEDFPKWLADCGDRPSVDELERLAYRCASRLPYRDRHTAAEKHIFKCFFCSLGIRRWENAIYEPSAWSERVVQFFRTLGRASDQHRAMRLARFVWYDWNLPIAADMTPPRMAEGAPANGDTERPRRRRRGPYTAETLLRLDRLPEPNMVELSVRKTALRPAILALWPEEGRTELLAPSVDVWDRIVEPTEEVKIQLPLRIPCDDAWLIALGFSPSNSPPLFGRRPEQICDLVADVVEAAKPPDLSSAEPKRLQIALLASKPGPWKVASICIDAPHERRSEGAP